MILALLLSPVRKHIGTFPSHLRMFCFDMCAIDFWGHPETSTVGAVGSSTGGVPMIIGAPTSPLGLSPKIEEEEEEEEEKRRS